MILKLIQINRDGLARLRQGDILSDVEFIENIDETDGKIVVSKIIFPLVIVLSQDCDLKWDFECRNKDDSNNDKYLFSVIVSPLYNYEHFLQGDHLSELNQKMQSISSKETKTDNKNLRNNENPRYHYLQFPDNIPIVNSVIDFKHYFCVNVETLKKHKEQHFVCNVSDLFRERISQRFTNYLSRIGLPEGS